MSKRVISDPTVAGWELDPATGYWMWSGAGSAYDDTELRSLISANTDLISDNATAISNNATAISENSERLDALEEGGGSFWVEESPGVIKYTGTAKATTLIGTG